jgi:hypothetical protein
MAQIKDYMLYPDRVDEIADRRQRPAFAGACR